MAQPHDRKRDSRPLPFKGEFVKPYFVCCSLGRVVTLPIGFLLFWVSCNSTDRVVAVFGRVVTLPILFVAGLCELESFLKP